jgi:hypothetical protein
MSPQSSQSPAPAPHPGDVLIATIRTASGTFYSLSVCPGPPQIMCATHAEALVKALAWAAREAVSIWTTLDGHTYRQEITPADSRNGAMHASSTDDI